MKEENDDQTQKQQYLRENILDKGYDANEFMEYFKESTGVQEISLNDYSMNQLTEVVAGFFTKKGENNSAPNAKNTYPTIPKELRSDSEQDINNDGSGNSNSLSSGQVNENGIEEIVKCIQMEKTDFSKIQDLEIKIVFPEKVESGIFSKPYISYGVSALPTNLNVRKRYSDFEWLNQKLTDHFVNCIVPPLCKKNYMEQFNEDFISKRARALERFMNGIAIHPILRNSFIFYDFMSIKDSEEFKQKKVMYEQPFKPKRINDFNNVDGLIKVNLSADNEIYFQNIIDDIEMNESLMTQIVHGYKNLFKLVLEINEKMTEIGYLWKKMETKSKKFYENSNTYTSYSIMKELMKDWTEMNKKIIIQTRQNIVETFRYMKNEYINFKPFAERVKEKKDVFFKAFDEFYFSKIESQKKSLTVQEKIEKFNDIDFTQISPMNTQHVRDAKNFYCGYLSSFISEYERIRTLNGKRIKDNTIKLIELLCKDYQEFYQICKGREANYDNIETEDDITKDLYKDNNSVISSQLK